MSEKKLIMHIVGNRPQFIKLSPVSREINSRGLEEIIIHTGQHYDKNMSDVFFEELEIPFPKENLNIGSGTHAQMTGKAMVEIEKVISKYNPSIAILYGDTNSTIAAAIVCAKAGIPIVHVEAGPRVGIKDNPEEINRITTDHLSTLLFCPDRISVENLKKEGIIDNVYFSGDVMYDQFLYTSKKGNDILDKIGIKPNAYVLMTWHRQENTSSKQRVNAIIEFIERLDLNIVFPMHPRTKNILHEYDLWNKITNINKLTIIEPVGYIEMVQLINNSKLILTDSGGLSKESYFGKSKCLFMWNAVVWPDLIESGWIRQINVEDKENVEIAKEIYSAGEAEYSSEMYYGDGRASKKIVDAILKFLED